MQACSRYLKLIYGEIDAGVHGHNQSQKKTGTVVVQQWDLLFVNCHWQFQHWVMPVPLNWIPISLNLFHVVWYTLVIYLWIKYICYEKVDWWSREMKKKTKSWLHVYMIQMNEILYQGQFRSFKCGLCEQYFYRDHTCMHHNALNLKLTAKLDMWYNFDIKETLLLINRHLHSHCHFKAIHFFFLLWTILVLLVLCLFTCTEF